MKKYIRYSLLLILLYGSQVLSQESLDQLLTIVEQSNPDLMAAQKLRDMQLLEARTANTPANPEIEFGYLWGSPTELGNRLDFGISQTFDFPTVYIKKNHLSKINRQKAELHYQIKRQQIMMKTRIMWLELVCLNKKINDYSQRLETANQLLKDVERKVELGEVNQLQLNQVRLKKMSIKNNLDRIKRQKKELESSILVLSGGVKVGINDLQFNPIGRLNIDSILMAYQSDYMNQLYTLEIEAQGKEVELIYNEKLPKIKAGYYSEYILDTKLQGVQAGLSIPLWENNQAVNTAKAGLAYIESDAAVYRNALKRKIHSIYDQWTQISEQVNEMEGILNASNNEILLEKAMKEGEITLTEYFYESDFYFETKLNLIDIKREMYLLEVELLKVYY